MFVKNKKNRSDSVSVVIAEKHGKSYTEHCTIGVRSDKTEIEKYQQEGKIWIRNYKKQYQPELDLYQRRKTQ